MPTVFRIAALFAVCLCCGAQSPDPFPELRHKTLPNGLPFAWPQSKTQPLGGEVRKEDVLRLLKGLFPDDSDHPIYDVESFRFAALSANKMYLVAVIDGNGRSFFNYLQIIFCEKDTCTMTGKGSDAPNDLDEQIVDIDGDGIDEIVIHKLVVGWEGGLTRPIYLYSITSLVNGEMVDVSEKYPAYFKTHILPKMQTTRRKVEKMIREDSENARRETEQKEGEQLDRIGRELKEERKFWNIKAEAELQFADDDYRRRVLGENSAGLDHAVRWAASDERDIKMFGILALSSIEVPEAAAAIRKLTTSPDPDVAMDARGAIERIAARDLEKKVKQAKGGGTQ